MFDADSAYCMEEAALMCGVSVENCVATAPTRGGWRRAPKYQELMDRSSRRSPSRRARRRRRRSWIAAPSGAPAARSDGPAPSLAVDTKTSTRIVEAGGVPMQSRRASGF